MKTALRTRMKLMGEPVDVLHELKRTHHWLPPHLQPLNRSLIEHAEVYRRTQEAGVRLTMELDMLRRLRPKLIPLTERRLLSEFFSRIEEALDQSGKARHLAIQDNDIDEHLDERLYRDMRNWLRRKQEKRANPELLQYLDRLLCAWYNGRRQREMFDL